MCIFNRGETFRKVMLRISEIRSLLPKVTKILALTATATTALRLEVSQILGMSDPLVVSLSPLSYFSNFTIGLCIRMNDTIQHSQQIVGNIRLYEERYSFLSVVSSPWVAINCLDLGREQLNK